MRLAVGNRTFTVELEAAAAATLDYPRQFELQVPDPAHWELANRVLPTLIE